MWVDGAVKIALRSASLFFCPRLLRSLERCPTLVPVECPRRGPLSGRKGVLRTKVSLSCWFQQPRGVENDNCTGASPNQCADKSGCTNKGCLRCCLWLSRVNGFACAAVSFPLAQALLPTLCRCAFAQVCSPLIPGAGCSPPRPVRCCSAPVCSAPLSVMLSSAPVCSQSCPLAAVLRIAPRPGAQHPPLGSAHEEAGSFQSVGGCI